MKICKVCGKEYDGAIEKCEICGAGFAPCYNQGIVDVSYRYPKMYVIRPQHFISLEKSHE